MFSDKLENIPRKSWKYLETYLNKERAKGVKYVRKSIAARETGIDEKKTLAMLSELCDEEVLAAKVKVSCPDCGAQHGKVYDRQSDVPEKAKSCMCGAEFDMANTTNWRVVYELPEDDLDFFLKLGERLKVFNEYANNLPQSVFEKQFQELEDHESPQRRGQLFDYFLGLLFQQMEGAVVKCRYNEDNPGELDVIANFSEGPQWALKSIGTSTGVENKWQQEAAAWNDIGAFATKIRDLHERHDTKVGFFVSMNGYTRDAKEALDQGNPRIVGLTEENIHQMVQDATAEDVLRDSVFY